MARPVGKRQLRLLAAIGSPFTLPIVADRLLHSLQRRGLVAPRGDDCFFQITPAGLRALADYHERGALAQFEDPKWKPPPVPPARAAA